MESKRVTSSFRDPSGYVFLEDDKVKRVVNRVYFSQYNSLTSSGLYQLLFDKKYLISHKEISSSDDKIVLEATKIPFFTYPYEWSFLQYKHAALLTLKIQKLALENGFVLKDASAFNITFHEGKPIFIDSLSFDFYKENQPWNAYKQFITHFFGPLLLAKYYGLDHLKSLANYIDGVPLDQLSRLLPLKSYFSPTIYSNIHLLAKFEGKHSSDKKPNTNAKLSKESQLKLLNSLYDFIQKLELNHTTEWDNYYNQTNYNDKSYLLKKELTKKWFSTIGGKKVIDIGGNDGTFSRELIDQAELLLVADVDANAVEQNYKQVLKNREKNIVPFVVDVLNPVANYGFNNEERFSFIDRIQKLELDGCMALAVIHHISLSGNIPFDFSANFFAKMASNLLIEFPTRDDSWVQFLLDSKRDFKDYFDFYNEENFELAYSNYFTIVSKEVIPTSNRILYQMKRK